MVFVPGLLPGDRASIELVQQKKTFARGDLVEVLEPSIHRQSAPCPEVDRGCGGCGLQHANPSTLRELKRELVVETLSRLGGIDDPVVEAGPELATSGYRTTIRAAVKNGRPALRKARSHDTLALDSCLVADPALADLLTSVRCGPTTEEVTLRVGVHTGERLVLASPTAAGVTAPADVTIVGRDELASGTTAHLFEEVAGHRWRISADAFFQSRPDGAQALVGLVRSALVAGGAAPECVIDAYGGGGLLSAAAPDSASLVHVEVSGSSASDARVNLSSGRFAGRQVRFHNSPVEGWHPVSADAVIADPARRGLGSDGADVLAATNAPVFVLVSCDIASAGRDAGLLVQRGYGFERATLVDMFPHTPHGEVVSVFRRPRSG